MTGETFAAWLLLPLVAVGLALGLGLLIERLSGRRMPALRVPIGLCATVCLSLLVYELGGNARVAAGLLMLLAVAGLLLERDELRRVRPGWLALAWLGAYVWHMAPVLLSGAWTWTGYNFVNDTAVQLLLADQLAAHGTAMAHLAQPTTASEHVRIYLITEYPLGSHALLASLGQLVPAPLQAVYQPTIAVLAGSLAVALGALARSIGLAAPAAAAAGLIAAGANLFYQYALQGNIKEVAFLAALAAAAATGRELAGADRPLRVVPAAAFCFAAAFGAYSAAAAPYLLALGAALAASALWLRRRAGIRRLLVAGGALLVVSLLVALPTLLSAVRFNQIASGTFASAERASDLGQLLRPLPAIQAAGIWLTGDYRGPVPGFRAAITVALCVLVLALVCLSVAFAVRRREPAGVALLTATALAAAYLLPRLSPYADGKVLALASPVLMLGAAVGAYMLWLRLPAVGLLAAGLVALGVVWSNAFAYHGVKLAPVDRLEALAEAAGRFRHVRGLVMLNEPEELAKNYTGGAPLNVATEAITPRQIQLRAPQTFAARYFDLDEQRLSYVEAFPVILKRRAPDASRPPANFALAYRNRWYEAWVKRPGPRVLRHLPLQAPQQVAVRPRCVDVERLAARARPGQYLVAARVPAEVRLDPRRGRVRGGWPKHPYLPGRVITETPGFASARVRVEAGGRYEAWVAGSFGRPITTTIDGRRIGAAGGVNNLGQWLPAGTVFIRPGRHRLALERPGGSLRPGDGYKGELGPLVLMRGNQAGLERVSPSRSRRLCASSWDWVELVAPSSQR